MVSPKVDVCQLNLRGYFGLESNDLGCFKLCVPFYVYFYHIRIPTSYLPTTAHSLLAFITIIILSDFSNRCTESARFISLQDPGHAVFRMPLSLVLFSWQHA